VQWHKLVALGSGMSGFGSEGNLGFATQPTSAGAINAFRGIALAPRKCTYGYANTQLGFRQLAGAEEDGEAAAEEQQQQEKEVA